MNKIYFAFGLVALAGFIASAAIHGVAFSGIPLGMPVESLSNSPLFLHVGLFLVFGPALYRVRKVPPYAPWRAIQPKAAIVVAALWIVALLGFFSMTSHGGYPKKIGAGFAVYQNGKFVRALSEPEYLAMMADMLRSFSGVWMVMYAYATAVLLFPHRTLQEPRP